MFLMATLDNGEKVISEFSKLARVQRYTAQVFAGSKPFNAWKVVGGTHEASGEAVLYRQRRMISGRKIVSIEVVEPMREDHGSSPEFFRRVSLMQRGERGIWIKPEGAELPNVPEGVTIADGVEYPLHRDMDSYRNYIIAQAGEGDAEVRYYIDGRGTEVTAFGDLPDNLDDEDDEDEDHDDDDESDY